MAVNSSTLSRVFVATKLVPAEKTVSALCDISELSKPVPVNLNTGFLYPKAVAVNTKLV